MHCRFKEVETLIILLGTLKLQIHMVLKRNHHTFLKKDCFSLFGILNLCHLFHLNYYLR